MSSRILKDSILTDKAFNALSLIEESIYHRLTVSADDYGIFYADPVLLLRILFPRKKDISEEDIREGLTAVISVKLTEPQFEGQTKTKLGNSEMRSFVDSVTVENVIRFFEENPKQARLRRNAVPSGSPRLRMKLSLNSHSTTTPSTTSPKGKSLNSPPCIQLWTCCRNTGE